MALYLITETSFIDNRLVSAGDEIESDVIPGAHWEPLDDAAIEARKAFDADEASRIALAKRNAEMLFLRENPANLTPLSQAETDYITNTPAREAAEREAEAKTAAKAVAKAAAVAKIAAAKQGSDLV